ncbi:MAG: enoyl-CoA hydratase/isomerase family protein, partial [Deltaproteobacteria bacterium]|nr:enoyl-CoA hydratase/isomerase family protein [Deltaproteobacteria bacterium]
MALIKFDQVSEHIGTITLNDPDNLNAMGEAMAAEFSALVEKLRSEKSDLRALILTGAGRAFSAGGNLAMLEQKQTLSGEENRMLMLKFYHSFLSILSLNVPLVAAINGHAIGAGLCLASACDIRIGGEQAKFGVTFTKLGLHPGMGGTYFLPRILGFPGAAELMLTGRIIDSAEALRLGLVSKVVPNDRLAQEALALATEIAGCGPESVRQ